MIPLTYDLHIHSCLSPCGDADMTPENIAGMAALKGLELIALTDHNSSRNCPALLTAARQYGILALPGMEVTTREEVHAVCLFAELSDALAFDAWIYARLMKIRNRPEIFGNQQLYDENDTICGEEEFLLINAVDVSFDALWDCVCAHRGVMFPAHIDKPSNSLIANLGWIPPDSKFTAAEVHNPDRIEALLSDHEYLRGCQILTSSDAHTLGAIQEAGPTILVKEKSASAVIEALLK